MTAQDKVTVLTFFAIIVIIVAILSFAQKAAPRYDASINGTLSHDAVIYSQISACNCSYQNQDVDKIIGWYHSGSADWVRDGFFYDCCNRTATYKNDSQWYDIRIDR